MVHAQLPGTTAQIVSAPGLGQEKIIGSPYSAEAVTETTQTLNNGSHIAQRSSSMIYRDSAGRERRGYPQTVIISDPVARARYVLYVYSHAARKEAIPNGLLRGPIGGGGGMTIEGGITVAGGTITPPIGRQDVFFESATAVNGANLPSPKVEQLGNLNIEGVQTESTRTTTTIPAGQIGNERDLEVVSECWYSRDLKATVLLKHNDPRSGETLYRLTQINRTEPSHSLFEVPADYKISLR
jgi:hypothetical protein